MILSAGLIKLTQINIIGLLSKKNLSQINLNSFFLLLLNYFYLMKFTNHLINFQTRQFAVIIFVFSHYHESTCFFTFSILDVEIPLMSHQDACSLFTLSIANENSSN